MGASTEQFFLYVYNTLMTLWLLFFGNRDAIKHVLMILQALFPAARVEGGCRD